MSAVHFQISTRWTERKRTIQVYVHDTAKELVEAGNAYNEAIGSKGDLSNAVGLCQGHYSEKYDKATDSWVLTPAAGIIRYTKGRLGSGVISHEAAHMACSIYDNDWREKHGDPFDDMDNQEVLAYLVGDITSKIVNKLYEKELL